MPALPLSASNSAVIIASLVPIQPGITTSLEDEDFLIVHSCVDSAGYKKRRRINSEGVCYSITYEDFEISYRITAEATANYGLSNYHPGKKLNESTLPAFANGVPFAGVTGGILILEDLARTRLPADLPGVAFTVARENATLVPGALIMPSVESVTTLSYPPTPPPSGARYDSIYNISTFWLRRLNLTGPVTSLVYLTDEPFYYTLPASTPAPSTLAAFLASPAALPAEVTGENVIEEVFTTTVPGGTQLRAGSSLLAPILASGGGIPGNTGYNFFWGGDAPGAGYFIASAISNATTAAEFIAGQQAPGDAPGHIGNAEVVEIYSLALGAWLTI